jgi:hypothetical protein
MLGAERYLSQLMGHGTSTGGVAWTPIFCYMYCSTDASILLDYGGRDLTLDVEGVIKLAFTMSST